MFSALIQRIVALFRTREPLLALPADVDVSYRGTESGPIERLLVHQQLEYWLGLIAPGQSLVECRARVVDIQCRTPGARTIVLRPNWRFNGHRAGQFITVSPSIDGKRYARNYSISSAPRWEWRAGRKRPSTIEITVGRVAGGRVSNWLHDHLQVGDVLPISQAAGEFGAAIGAGERPVLLVAGGTGVTPMRALLEELSQGGRLNDVHLVHFAPTRERAIFAADFEALSSAHSGFQYHLVETRNGGERLTRSLLESFMPGNTDAQMHVCGPASLANALKAIAAERAGAEVHTEVFDERLMASDAAPGTAGGRVTLRRSGRTFSADASTTLLEQIEAQGVKPASGCRMGICKTCTCTRLGGSTMNLRTGEVSSGRESIQLCSSVALTAVELDL